MDGPRGLSVGGAFGASHILAAPHCQRRRCQPSFLSTDSRVKPAEEEAGQQAGLYTISDFTMLGKIHRKHLFCFVLFRLHHISDSARI